MSCTPDMTSMSLAAAVASRTGKVIKNMASMFLKNYVNAETQQTFKLYCIACITNMYKDSKTM